MSKEFLDEALGRLVSSGVVVREGSKLSFTEEWIKFLMGFVRYDMTSREIADGMAKALREFYGSKGLSCDIRLDLSWVKQIFAAQLAGADETSREAVKNFVEAVKPDT